MMIVRITNNATATTLHVNGVVLAANETILVPFHGHRVDLGTDGKINAFHVDGTNTFGISATGANNFTKVELGHLAKNELFSVILSS